MLIGIAAAFLPHTTKPSVASKLAQANHPVAVPPLQWLPVLLAYSTYRRTASTAVERGAVRGMHRPTPQSRFSWDALTVTSATQCGWYKCYFPSQRENEGWLVGRPRTTQWRPRFRDVAPPTLWFPPYSRAWALAEELRTGFGVDHLLRGPPFLATLPHEQATR